MSCSKSDAFRKLNSHAVGLAVVQPLDFEIDFARNPISGSAARFFVITIKFIITAIFEIKIRIFAHFCNKYNQK